MAAHATTFIHRWTWVVLLNAITPHSSARLPTTGCPQPLDASRSCFAESLGDTCPDCKCEEYRALGGTSQGEWECANARNCDWRRMDNVTRELALLAPPGGALGMLYGGTCKVDLVHACGIQPVVMPPDRTVSGPLFVTLNAVGAFLFVLMLLNLGDYQILTRSGIFQRILAPLLALAFGALVVSIALTTDFGSVFGVFPEKVANFGEVRVLGLELFTRFFYPFGVISLLLVVAMTGAVLLAKRRL